jgi:hypothetical protein
MTNLDDLIAAVMRNSPDLKAPYVPADTATAGCQYIWELPDHQYRALPAELRAVSRRAITTITPPDQENR